MIDFFATRADNLEPQEDKKIVSAESKKAKEKENPPRKRKEKTLT